MKLFWTSLFFLIIVPTNAQKADSLRNRWLLASGYTAFCGTTFGLLNSQWYANQPLSSFHWFNDNHEWGGMDKLGHAHTCYQISRGGVAAMRATGFSPRQAAWYGGMSGVLFMTGIEYLDGKSLRWGASPGDLIANVFGGLIGTYQALNPESRNFCFKYSYVQNPIADVRPEMFGNGPVSRMLKNYNGQTYWLSVPISKKYPFLLASVGYGINGYYGGGDNIFENAQGVQDYSNAPRYSEFYASLDIDFTKVPTKSKFLKKTFFLMNYFKFPFPALEYSKIQGVQLRGFR
jgi:hypothetical protein